MLQVLEELSTRLVNLVRSLCVMVYSSRPARAKQANKSSSTGYNTHASIAQGLRKSRRTREWKNANRKAHDGFDAYFQKMFDNTVYETKDKDEIKFNQAKIPKIHHQARQHRVAKQESKVSINEIKVQLQQKYRRKLHRSTSQILGIEKRGKIPKVILRRAKKQRQELNPGLFSENSRPLRVCFTKHHRAADGGQPAVIRVRK